MPIPGAPVTILVVEDEVAIATMLCDILADEGYTVVTAAHGRAALAILTQQPIACILTDVMMPVMDGIALAHWVRQQPALAQLPIIAITATPTVACAAFTVVLHKPFHLNTLLLTVQQIVPPPPA